MPTGISEKELKYAFYKNVIETQNTVRMVARSAMDGNSSGPSSPMTIFRPTSWEDDYDLVLSLCVDGTQRLTADWDEGGDKNPHDILRDWHERMASAKMDYGVSRPQSITPSTSNWHIWGDAEINWDRVKEMLLISGNVGYHEMNYQKGFCALRPPWKNKYDMTFTDSIGMRFHRQPDRDMVAGFNWTHTPEPEVTGSGWDDLGWDDE